MKCKNIVAAVTAFCLIGSNAICNIGETVIANAAEEASVTERPIGDVTGDNAVDILDVIRVNKFILGVSKIEDADKEFADINKDGNIDSSDSLSILKKALGISEQAEVSGLVIDSAWVKENYHGEAEFTIPDGATIIDENAFYNCENLTSITIPDSVIKIKADAFSNCYRLASIEIPENVTEIEREAFCGCYNMKFAYLPNGITSIEPGTFYNCQKLESIEIPDGVTKIGTEAFLGCENLTSVEIPGSVTELEKSVFEQCISLESVNLPEGVISVGESAFAGCESLISVDIPSSLTYIGTGAFCWCRKLESFNIPDSDNVIKMGDNIFHSSGLESLYIPNSLIEIDCQTFKSIETLKTITVSEDNPNYASADGVVYSKDMKTVITCPKGKRKVTISDEAETIDILAFEYCKNLISVDIPNSVTKIADNAFSDCCNLTIQCSKGSYAEQYAKEHNIPCRAE